MIKPFYGIFSTLARTSVIIVINFVMSECVNILKMMQNFRNHQAQCLTLVLLSSESLWTRFL